MSPGLGVCVLERLVEEGTGALGTAEYGNSAITTTVS